MAKIKTETKTKKELEYTIIARRKEFVLGEPRVRGEVIKVSKEGLDSLKGTKYQDQVEAQLNPKPKTKTKTGK